MNRLGKEKSPYLLQHANNPVDWYPWGDEAFEKARRENKPILLSIGYSTCHWCHVMERESFEDAATAKVMNDNLVCIKLDREERPDIDAIYMNAVTALTGSGGWPLNVFLTHELEPFYGGTYFPPKPAFKRPSWPQLVEGVGKAWRDPDARKNIAADGKKLAEAVKEMTQADPAVETLSAAWIEVGIQAFKSAFDPDLGGFSPPPKFPMPVNQRLLMEAGDKQAREMALFSLRAMALGGIHDHLGGGFARYSTDERWHVPHFEKMLYDNAQLAQNYLQGYQLSQDEFLAETARGIFSYVLRDMKAPGGAFYSAEDADSEVKGEQHKVEGAFYAFTKEEIFDVLGREEGEKFAYAFGAEISGNVDFDPHGDFKGKNVLFLKEPQGFKEAREKLRLFREKRPRPSRDEKILTSWNGLMIQALAMGYQVLGDEAYLKAGEAAAEFLWREMHDKRLYRRFADGERAIEANADDYTQLIAALIDLYECLGEGKWLERAVELQKELREGYFDGATGALWLTREGHDKNVFARVEETQDNVEPSAASTFARNAHRLWLLTGKDAYRADAELGLRRLGTLMQKHPRASAGALAALNVFLRPSLHIVVAGDAKSGLARRLRAAHAPGRALVFGKPHFAEFAQKDGKPTAYICVDQACKLPVNDPDEALKLLPKN